MPAINSAFTIVRRQRANLREKVEVKNHVNWIAARRQQTRMYNKKSHASAQRETIELHHSRGLSLDVIGMRMDRNKGAVAALVHQGTMRLRELPSNQVSS